MDWLLAAHQAAPLQYEMGGAWSPASIRDQMVRGQELARRAIAAGLIDDKRRLIVIGAGAGGMAAAMTARTAGVPVVVIEASGGVFPRQVGVTSRVIHPYLYDWPHERHREKGLVDPAALPWREGTADLAARQWARALGARFDIFYNSSVTRPFFGAAIKVRRGVASIHVQTHDATGVTRGWLEGGMVLSSIGFGGELTEVPARNGSVYRGWDFWGNDAMALPNLGATTAPRILIAGGGDGALQDTLRALLVPSVHDPRALLEKLPTVPHEIRAAVVDAEDTATRAWLWAAGGADDCPILTDLETRIDHAAGRWWASAKAEIRRSLAPLWRRDVTSVDLVHSCTHFGRSYALNRFLYYVLENAVENAQVRFVRRRGLYLERVDGGHACENNGPCPGPHRASFTTKACAPDARGLTTVPPVVEYDLVILRGGLKPRASVFTRALVANRRQHLPDRARAAVALATRPSTEIVRTDRQRRLPFVAAAAASIAKLLNWKLASGGAFAVLSWFTWSLLPDSPTIRAVVGMLSFSFGVSVGWVVDRSSGSSAASPEHGRKLDQA